MRGDLDGASEPTPAPPPQRTPKPSPPRDTGDGRVSFKTLDDYREDWEKKAMEEGADVGHKTPTGRGGGDGGGSDGGSGSGSSGRGRRRASPPREVGNAPASSYGGTSVYSGGASVFGGTTASASSAASTLLNEAQLSAVTSTILEGLLKDLPRQQEDYHQRHLREAISEAMAAAQIVQRNAAPPHQRGTLRSPGEPPPPPPRRGFLGRRLKAPPETTASVATAAGGPANDGGSAAEKAGGGLGGLGGRFASSVGGLGAGMARGAQPGWLKHGREALQSMAPRSTEAIQEIGIGDLVCLTLSEVGRVVGDVRLKHLGVEQLLMPGETRGSGGGAMAEDYAFRVLPRLNYRARKEHLHAAQERSLDKHAGAIPAFSRESVQRLNELADQERLLNRDLLAKVRSRSVRVGGPSAQGARAVKSTH